MKSFQRIEGLDREKDRAAGRSRVDREIVFAVFGSFRDLRGPRPPIHLE